VKTDKAHQEKIAKQRKGGKEFDGAKQPLAKKGDSKEGERGGKFVFREADSF